MKRSLAFIAGIALLVSCESEPVTRKVTDLSAGGTANCYIVNEGGDYLFDPALDSKAERPVLIWQVRPGMISDISLDGNGNVLFSVSEAAFGNAVVGVVDSEGSVLWSWHIWYPTEEIRPVGDKRFMNMNLGAIISSAESVEDLPQTYGLMYQWGRKDPLPGSPVVTGDTKTMPSEVYDADGNVVEVKYQWSSAESLGDDLWGKGEEKTCYDPCPAGWMVPGEDVYESFSLSGTNYTADMSLFNVEDINGDGKIGPEDYRGGWYFKVSETESSFFPAAARYDASWKMLMGSMTGYWGNYWTAGPEQSGTAVAMGFSSKNMSLRDDWTVTPKSVGSRAYAFSVRCVKYTPRKI